MPVSYNPLWKAIVRRRSTQRQFCERLDVDRGEFYFAHLSWGDALSTTRSRSEKLPRRRLTGQRLLWSETNAIRECTAAC